MKNLTITLNENGKERTYFCDNYNEKDLSNLLTKLDKVLYNENLEYAPDPFTGKLTGYIFKTASVSPGAKKFLRKTIIEFRG